MESVSLLCTDHTLLRKKCSLLETILQSRPEGRFVISELTHSLQRLLEDHSEREQPVLQQYRNQQNIHAVAGFALDHAVERQILRLVHQLLASRMKSSRSLIILRLSQAVEQLQIQMARQERLVFPFINEAALTRKAGLMPVSESMSVNEVLHRFPTARQIFDELHVNRFEEGSDSVDEVAWRHGANVSDILDQLRQAVENVPSYWYGE